MRSTKRAELRRNERGNGTVVVVLSMVDASDAMSMSTFMACSADCDDGHEFVCNESSCVLRGVILVGQGALFIDRMEACWDVDV